MPSFRLLRYYGQAPWERANILVKQKYITYVCIHVKTIRIEVFNAYLILVYGLPHIVVSLVGLTM